MIAKLHETKLKQQKCVKDSRLTDFLKKGKKKTFFKQWGKQRVILYDLNRLYREFNKVD